MTEEHLIEYLKIVAVDGKIDKWFFNKLLKAADINKTKREKLKQILNADGYELIIPHENEEKFKIHYTDRDSYNMYEQKTIFKFMRDKKINKEIQKIIKHKFVQDNFGLVNFVMKQHNLYDRGYNSIDTDDLFVAGVDGLIRAIDKFDPDMNNMFSTYAFHWVSQGLQREIFDKDKTIRIPVHTNENLNTYNYYLELYGEESLADKAFIEHLNSRKENERKEELAIMSEKERRNKLKNMNRATINTLELIKTIPIASQSVEDFIVRENEDEVIFSNKDLSKMTSDYNTENTVVSDVYTSELLNIVREILGSDRDYDIFVRRSGIYDKETLEEISKDYDITRERIRQIDARNKRKILRHPSFKKFIK